jgi:hypothetical protein
MDVHLGSRLQLAGRALPTQPVAPVCVLLARSVLCNAHRHVVCETGFSVRRDGFNVACISAASATFAVCDTAQRDQVARVATVPLQKV